MPGFTLILLAGSLSFGGPRREPPADRWFAKDKLYHFAISATVQAATHASLRANGSDYREASLTAGVVTLSLGIGKEIWDRDRGRIFSLKDLAADAAGGGAAAVMARQVDHR